MLMHLIILTENKITYPCVKKYFFVSFLFLRATRNRKLCFDHQHIT